MICRPWEFADTGWRVLDVMNKGKPFRRNEWTALQIRVRDGTREHRFLDLGKHKNLDQAWAYAERIMEPRLH